MNDRLKAFWLGLFIIFALVLFIWLVLFLKPGIGNGQVTLKVRFSNIDKISTGTRVTFAGKLVGEVKKIQEISNPRQALADSNGNLYIFELTLKVDSSVKVYTYDEILFATSGLLGEKSIAILPRSTPPGAPPAQNITHDILYAQSSEGVEQTLNKLVQMANMFENTLTRINGAITCFTSATQELHSFMNRINETDIAGKAAVASDSLIAAMRKAEDFFSVAEKNHLIERMGTSFEHLALISGQIAQGEGSLGRLVNSDCLYVSLTSVLCQLQAILDDIRQFGVLYQFDRKWQRMHDPHRCSN